MEANLTVNILSIISLIYTILFSCKNIKFDIEAKLNKINNSMMLLTIFMLFLEIGNLLLPITSNIFFIIANHLLRILILISIPLLPILGIAFLKSILKLKYSIKKLLIPNMFNILLCLLNLKFNFLYTISSNNTYSRSHYFLSSVSFACLYLLYFLFILIKNKKIFFKYQFIYFLFCLFTLTFSASIQLIFKTIYIFWPICAAILVINYIVIQQKTLYYNDITLIKNKFALTNALYDLIVNKTMFLLIFIQIENLNSVAESFGFNEENEVIIQTYKLSKNFISHKGELFHYKNDCFVALIDYNSKISINKIMKDIDKLFSNSYQYFNSKYILKYNFSYDLFDNNYTNTFDYLYHIDNIIYNFPSENTKN